MPKRTANAHARRKRAPAAGEKWDDVNKRVTFHCPVFLEELIEREARKSGRSKSRIIVDALRQHLHVSR